MSKDKWNARKELELSMCESIKTSPSMNGYALAMITACVVSIIAMSYSFLIMEKLMTSGCKRTCCSEVAK